MTKDVPSCVTVVGIPAKVVQPAAKRQEQPAFVAYGTPTGDLPDPVARAIEGLMEEVSRLRARIVELEARNEAGGEVDGLGVEPSAEDGAAEAPQGKC